MPAIAPPATVLVTGANGFIATWVIHELLEHGYTVRGTVRREREKASLLKLFKDELESGRLDLVVVSDITRPGAFDEAIKDINAIAHIASPFTFDVDDPEDLIRPAVNGTLEILESALKVAALTAVLGRGSQLKRVLFLSSVGAVYDRTTPGKVDEACWNENSVMEVKEKGREARGLDVYCASKVLAERAAWKFYAEHADGISWDLVTLCPPLVFGPVLNELSSPAKLCTSVGFFYQIMLSEEEISEMYMEFQAMWIDVRDVAFSHVKALEVPEAGGQRFLISAEEFIVQEFLDVANELGFRGIRKGTPGAGKSTGYRIELDTAKVSRVLGITYRDRRTMLKDTIENLRARGW